MNTCLEYLYKSCKMQFKLSWLNKLSASKNNEFVSNFLMGWHVLYMMPWIGTKTWDFAK